jgi:hypothetical protein
MLEEGRLNTIDLLKKELENFFKKNEPEALKKINKKEVKERRQAEMINDTVSGVKFPDVSKLIEKISLIEHFYDLTWDDFKDDKLRDEFLEKGIMEKNEIDSIVEMKKAFDVQQ